MYDRGEIDSEADFELVDGEIIFLTNHPIRNTRRLVRQSSQHCFRSLKRLVRG